MEESAVGNPSSAFRFRPLRFAAFGSSAPLPPAVIYRGLCATVLASSLTEGGGAYGGRRVDVLPLPAREGKRRPEGEAGEGQALARRSGGEA